MKDHAMDKLAGNIGQPGRNDAQAEAACREVVNAYARCVDTFDDDTLTQMFAKEAHWLRPDAEPLKGRDAIHAFLGKRDRAISIRHVISNVLIDVQDAIRA